MKYTTDNPLRVFTAFSGIESQLLALERLKRNFPPFDYVCVGWSEIDAHAIKAHDALFPDLADRNYGDICKIDWAQVPDFDLFTYSSPCFVAGTMVLTSNGFKPIEDIVAGDAAITHSNEYRDVTIPMSRDYDGDIYTIRAMCALDVECTPNHPYYTRLRYRHGHLMQRAFKLAEWVEAKDLTKDHYLGYAVNRRSDLPIWGGAVNNQWGHHRNINKLSPLFVNGRFWYVMGRYVGDGWRKESKTGKGIIICCSDRNRDTLLAALDAIGWHYYICQERTVDKVTICSNEINAFVARYGYKATGKRIDGETLDLPAELLKSFLDGIMESDGCIANGWWQITTVSKELVLGVAQVVAKVYHRACSLSFYDRPVTVVIEGRECNQHGSYMARWHIDRRKQDHAFYEDGYIWFPISKIWKERRQVKVYNMEVATDHSYTANGCIVHNCQDFSMAGLRKGGAEDSGTRSSLLWECRKAILAKKPKYTLFENVKGLLTKKMKPYFDKWLAELDSYGYTSFAKVLNAKDYQIPQNRERIFVFSVLDCDAPYYFPKAMPQTRCLRDVLEPEPVDERYYLSEKVLATFKRRNEIPGLGFHFEPKDGGA